MTPKPDDRLLVTRADAARMLSLSEGTVKALTEPEGPLPVIRIGRAVRYHVDDLRAFVASRRSPLVPSRDAGVVSSETGKA